MATRFLIILTVWLVVFAFRVISLGGLDPTYRDEKVGLFAPLRENLAQIIDQSLPFPQNTLLAGIILGADKIPMFLKNDLKTTSTIHIAVVSGQNLSLLSGLILNLAAFLGRKKTVTLIVIVILFYSLLTGLEVPVLRAALMVGLAYLAQLLGKENAGSWVLFLVAGGMLIFNPNWLLSISFQLSFLATFGVIVVAPILLERLKAVPNILRQDLGVTLAAQVMVLPIIAYNFGQISLVGILVNSLILWVIPIVMAAGFGVLIAGVISTLLGQIIGLVPGVLLTYIIYLVEFFAKLPGASFKIGETGVWMWAGYYLLIGAGVWILKVRQTIDGRG